MRRTIIWATVILILASCSHDGLERLSWEQSRQATVTVLVTPYGLGDNNYNDAMIEGIFAFARNSGVRLKLLQPQGTLDAISMYDQWIQDNRTQDSAVLILGNSWYVNAVREKTPQLSGKGSRVLLLESDDTIQGVSTVSVKRYGASYLAGAMTSGFDALILTASPQYPVIDETVKGFTDGRKAHPGRHDGRDCITRMSILTQDESGFNMPDSAYRYLARQSKVYGASDEFIFPLLRGSQTGVIRYLNDNPLTKQLMVGVEVNMSGQSSRIPFSVVIHIGRVAYSCLMEWHSGIEWPQARRFGLEDGMADVEVAPHFRKHICVWDERYDQADTFSRLYEQYFDEAMRAERDK